MERAYTRTSFGQLHYIAEGEGDALILLHHAGASAKEFSDVIPRLSRRFQVIAMDLPGHGGSDAPPEAPSIVGYARILVEFMDGLGIGKAHLGGLYTGAEICLKTAVLHPSRVNSIILCGVLCRDQASLDALLPQEVLTAPPIEADGSHLIDAWKFQTMFAREGTSPERIHWLVTEHLNSWTHEPLAHRACYLQTEESKADMPRVSCPALMLNGSRDPLKDDAIAVADLIPGCRLVTIPDADVHVALNFSREYAEAISSFLA